MTIFPRKVFQLNRLGVYRLCLTQLNLLKYNDDTDRPLEYQKKLLAEEIFLALLEASLKCLFKMFGTSFLPLHNLKLCFIDHRSLMTYPTSL